jgi:uncharacterized protein (TIGR03437 family)
MNRILLLLALVALPASGAPQVLGIVNGASYTPAGIPNSGIARGSIFVVFGRELGPSDLQSANTFPLSTSLGGTSVRATVGTTAVDALMLYTSASQVAAILPSATPEGIGYLQVTYNGRTSEAGAFRVVRSWPGVLAQNQSGSGPALAQNFNAMSDQPRNSISQPARAGQVVTLWATGLGPVTDNEAMPPIPRDLDLPVQLYVGGKQAVVQYKGRSGCCSGVDQIVFQVPSGVSGCSVPVVVQVDTAVSNFTTIAIADANGNDCSDVTGISGSSLAKLQGGGTLRIASIVLSVNKFDIVSEVGAAQFAEIGMATLSNWVPLGMPSTGSCTVGLAPPTPQMFSPPGPITGLDAGRFLTVTGPKGSRQVLLQGGGVYRETFATGTVVQFLEPGSYVVDNGSGGATVGSFQANLNVPADLTSTVQTSPSGTIVTWRGGDPSSYVIIQGTGVSTTGLRSTFSCVERASAGQFALPSYVTASLPGSPTGIVVSAATGFFPGGRFQATGLDYGFLSYCSPTSAMCIGNFFYYDDY